LTLVDVQSEEGEGAPLDGSVRRPVDALHEAQVHFPEQGVAAPVRPGAAHLGDADEAVEIGDGARLAAEARVRRIRRPRKSEVDARAAERVRDGKRAAGDGYGPGTWHTAVFQLFQGQPGTHEATARTPRPAPGGRPPGTSDLRVVRPRIEP